MQNPVFYQLCLFTSLEHILVENPDPAVSLS